MRYLTTKKRLLREARSFGCSVVEISQEPAVHKISKKNKTLFFYRNFFPMNTKNAVLLANNKDITKTILLENGISVPRGITAESAEQAIHSMNIQSIVYPVVVKPIDGLCGKGVTVDIRDDRGLSEAVEYLTHAKEHSQALKDSRFVVEEMFSGADHRVLVLDGNVIACAKRVPAHVFGDGKRSVDDLVVAFNQQRPKKYQIKPDEETDRLLKTQGKTLQSVPKDGEHVNLRKNANISSGGLSLDQTSIISKRFRDISVQAAESLGLRFAGVDLLTHDIASENPAAPYTIIEVNGNVLGYDIHEEPIITGKSVNVSKILIETLFA